MIKFLCDTGDETELLIDISPSGRLYIGLVCDGMEIDFLLSQKDAIEVAFKIKDAIENGRGIS